jgi:hypothetical protein
MYEPMGCSGCDAVGFYPDEVVSGYWIVGKDEYYQIQDVNIFVAVNDDNRTEATHTYCLDCAPCECGRHEKFVAHNIRNIVDWQIKCQPIWID